MIYISSKGGENTVLFKDFICEKWWRQNKKSNMIIVHNNTTSIRNRIIPNVYVTSIKIYKLLWKISDFILTKQIYFLFSFFLSIPSIGFATLPIHLLDPVVFIVLIFLFFILSPFLLQSPVAFPLGEHSETLFTALNFHNIISFPKLAWVLELIALKVQEILKHWWVMTHPILATVIGYDKAFNMCFYST